MLCKLKDALKNLYNKPLAFSLAAATVLVFIVEALSRHNLAGGFLFLISEPLFFVMNILIAATIISIGFLLPKRDFYIIISMFIILVLAIVNFILLFIRVTPFEAIDFEILRTGISIVNIYLSVPLLILCVIGILAALFGIVILFIKTTKRKIIIKKALPNFLSLLFVSAILVFTLMATGKIEYHVTDKNQAYDTYGFTYSFARSMFDRGISRPDDYSEYTVEQILESIDAPSRTADEKPNIIFVQLESFMDLSHFKNISFEREVTPNFKALKENYPSGELTVPSVGAGTANTEFEVITGMCLDYFGAGEYPFKTILKEKACESLAYNLRAEGYSTHGMHNHTGTFYDRNIAYKNLGFDTFTSIEYMTSYDTNPYGWAKDYVLQDEILKALDTTKESDLVYAVSVQGHGKYPSNEIPGEKLINVECIDDETLRHEFSYLAYQLWEMDDFIGKLINTLSSYNEKCVLVLYGDHQPSIEYSIDDIDLDSKYKSEYVIWSNYNIEAEDKNLESYQLSAHVLECAKMNDGTLTKLHQSYSTNSQYQKALETLQYDMLYGDELSTKGLKFTPVDMKMGTEDIVIESVSQVDGRYYIIGSGFTRSSRVFANGKEKKSVYITDTVILIDNDNLEDGEEITIRQITDDFVTLSETNSVIYKSK